MTSSHQRATSGALFILILSGLMAFTSLSTDIYLPAMPVMAAQLQGDAELTITGFLIGFALAQLVWGTDKRSTRASHTAVYRHGAVYYRFRGLCTIDHYRSDCFLARISGPGRLYRADAGAGDGPRSLCPYPRGADAFDADYRDGDCADCRSAHWRAAD